MPEHIVGMMWNKNEGDILRDTISSALQKVDTLVIADDGSTDDSWDIIQRFASHHRDQIEHIRQSPSKNDPAQRQALLNIIRERYRPEDTWVQIIESDIMILDTDIHKAVAERSDDVKMLWVMLNAIIKREETWEELDTYPNWPKPIQEIMTAAHHTENMTYTFRPFDKLQFSIDPWRPWPRGFSFHKGQASPRHTDYTPLLAHYGYRGPTHVWKKYKGVSPRRYPGWNMSSPESILKTVGYFNGQWNNSPFAMSREGWKRRKHDS